MCKQLIPSLGFNNTPRARQSQSSFPPRRTETNYPEEERGRRVRVKMSLQPKSPCSSVFIVFMFVQLQCSGESNRGLTELLSVFLSRNPQTARYQHFPATPSFSHPTSLSNLTGSGKPQLCNLPFPRGEFKHTAWIICPRSQIQRHIYLGISGQVSP